MGDPVWFWHEIVSPHVAGLASALAIRGHEVVYVARRQMSASRSGLGWEAPGTAPARLMLAPDPRDIDALVRRAPANSIHLYPGFRRNEMGGVRKKLAQRRLRCWVYIERVDDYGWQGRMKRAAYGHLVSRQRARIEGMLAIGQTAPQWFADRGMPQRDIFPFA